MLPHWRRYLLETLHTSALTYVFPHPDVMTDRSFWDSGPNKLFYPLLCRQIDCRPNLEDTDPILSIDKEVEWGLLKTLYLNPLQWLVTMVGAIHSAGIAMVAACLWWDGAPVWASLTEPLVGKILVGVALTLGPLAAFFARRHLRIMNRIERKYAEEQNLEPHDWWTRYRARPHTLFGSFELTDEDLVYTEGREQRMEKARRKTLADYDERIAELQEEIELREAAHEQMRERGQTPSVEEIRQLNERKERLDELLYRRQFTDEYYELLKEGKVAEIIRQSEEFDRWIEKDDRQLRERIDRLDLDLDYDLELGDESDSEADE